MIHPSDREFGVPVAVRDGQRAPVTCATCGCRLEGAGDGTSFRHFNPLAGRDARGCRVACVDLVHGADGLPLAS
jgi:hypothetical protein